MQNNRENVAPIKTEGLLLEHTKFSLSITLGCVLWAIDTDNMSVFPHILKTCPYTDDVFCNNDAKKLRNQPDSKPLKMSVTQFPSV